MATSTRTTPAGRAEPADDRDVMITTLTRIVNRLIVSHVATGPAATFRQICTLQLHIASDAEVDVIEAWMTAHHQGG